MAEGMTSPFAIAKVLDAHIVSLLMHIDIEALPAAERELLRQLKRQVTDIRLDVRDYGMAETHPEQDRLATEAKKRLDQLERLVVQAGGLNLIGPVDIAYLSAQTQQLMAKL